jgi:leucyl/phenylalanyl-tRNA--protein transferase
MPNAGWMSRTTEQAALFVHQTPLIPQLPPDPRAPFPDPEQALDTPDGLLAWGGGLEPERLCNAYQQGIFPWFSEDQPILWWCPSVRCVLFPADIHISRRLQRLIRQQKYQVSADRAFNQVIRGCALPRVNQDSTWITAGMIDAYRELHRLGHAHSIEVWQDDRLVGGMYGLSFGRIFFGESMFSLAADASKVAMVSLCRQLVKWDFALLDCQVGNPHLERMGAVEISRQSFLATVASNVRRNAPAMSYSQALGAGGG